MSNLKEIWLFYVVGYRNVYTTLTRILSSAKSQTFIMSPAVTNLTAAAS